MKTNLFRIAALAITGLSLSACIVAPVGPGHRHGRGYYSERPIYYAAPAPRYYGGYGGYGHRRW